MNITGSTALVTGANRGLGARLVHELLDNGAARVYATARDPRSLDELAADPRVRILALDLLDPASITAAADSARDVDLLINNAGVLNFGGVLDIDVDAAEVDMATNYFGTMRVSRAFAPILAANTPSALVNVLTLIALAPVGGMAGYSASKAAAHSMTQALRAELRGRGVQVIGAYPGGMDTDMLAGVDAVKADPAVVARRIVAGIAAGDPVIWPDDTSSAAGSVYQAAPWDLEQMLAG